MIPERQSVSQSVRCSPHHPSGHPHPAASWRQRWCHHPPRHTRHASQSLSLLTSGASTYAVQPAVSHIQATKSRPTTPKPNPISCEPRIPLHHTPNNKPSALPHALPHTHSLHNPTTCMYRHPSSGHRLSNYVGWAHWWYSILIHKSWLSIVCVLPLDQLIHVLPSYLVLLRDLAQGGQLSGHDPLRAMLVHDIRLWWWGVGAAVLMGLMNGCERVCSLEGGGGARQAR